MFGSTAVELYRMLREIPFICATQVAFLNSSRETQGRRRILGAHYTNGSVGPQETCVQAEIECGHSPGVRWQLTPTHDSERV